jgi:hypothetical protein
MILIISANWMMALYPCRFRALMTENIYVRHVFGFFTMIFFVVLTNSDGSLNLQTTFIDSIYLYTLFIFLLRTPLFIFLAILALLAGLYVLNIKKKEINEDKKIEEKTREEYLRILSIIRNVTSITIYFLLFLGFFIYLGQKKLEYKNKFDYITFLFGKIECQNTTPSSSNSYYNGIMHALD